MNETEIKFVGYLEEKLREIEDMKDCDNSIGYRTDMTKYPVLVGTINAIIIDIITGDYKK